MVPEADRDASADTARFQAFAARKEEELPARDQEPGVRIGMLIGVVTAVAILAAIIGVLVVG